MSLRSSFLLSLTVLTTASIVSVPAHAAGPYLPSYNTWVRSIRDRGVAICSPIDSPDPYVPEVGGQPLCVPYYRGFKPDAKYPSQSDMPYYYATPGYSYRQPGYGYGGSSQSVYALRDYGYFSGARKDEANLLHMGGYNPPSNRSARPDIVDMIQSGQ